MEAKVRRPHASTHRGAAPVRIDDPETNVWKLAAEQGVEPVANIDELYGTFWPEDESVDDFIAAMKEWDREGA